ncbi:phosphoenolpyruvate carboxykinase (ATP) [Acetobacter musti]|uniref:Phosphoenolpyruvate carboxykinase (ATP) n=1 Tax=Acetobacter musti TaxID=864732 RepID=A0ABX0JT37_9PROT|nr:phosphoenolpyruvate carboxykinase (ATP) [Acetobacter musti]NHN86351.1 phosphoenolpyruvate carboxykinase (ATP) [Acetobacter musti]
MKKAGSEQFFRELSGTGIEAESSVWANLSCAALVEHAIRRNEAKLSDSGAVVALTGEHTGRSVRDKFIVREPDSEADVWWGDTNASLEPEKFRQAGQDVRAWLAKQDLFVQDLYAGADPAHRIRVRVVTTHAWNALFARNMFIRPGKDELERFEPDYVILHAPEFRMQPAVHGTRSETGVLLSFGQRLIVIAGTEYAGEIKKAIFTVMNWLLPSQNVLPMHCSANVGENEDVALFFGLSGTGKTTLSANSRRQLIGDDEHGWGQDGVFNFEGGCYAKVINLSREAEPEIWAASNRFGAVLENVILDDDRVPRFDDGSLTENTRSCYPIDYVPNARLSGRAGKPRHVIMLTADAFGVLPPISRLNPAEAAYQFMSGYTARISGTEKGLGKEPQATFSACFGAPFLPRTPQTYARQLETFLSEQNVTCWLLNTGWTGGIYGTGTRIRLAHTRALVDAVLNGDLDHASFRVEPHFGLMIPVSVPGVPDDLPDPENAWEDKAAYARTARGLVARFVDNFRSMEAGAPKAVQVVARAWMDRAAR